MPSGDLVERQNEVYSIDYDGHLLGWPTRLSEKEQLLNLPETQEVSAFALVPDNLRAVFGTREGILKIYNYTQQTWQDSINAHQKQISRIVVEPEATWLATASYDKTVKFWKINADKGFELETILPHDTPVSALAVSSNGY